MVDDYGNRGDRSYKPNPRLARFIDVLFILHAEHEMNCSTAAARHLTSSEIGTVENISEFIEGVKNRKQKMSGFGHRVYKNYGPRAKVAVALEKATLSDEYFIKRKLYPNVDFYSGLIYRAMGFPPEFFTVLFAILRMAGYLAHWRESLDDPDTKIMRPQ
ncbi:hypothetical protein ACFE04_020114 [Oxalis oulophora]